MTDITELTGVTKHSNQHRLSRLIIEAPNDELRQLAVEVEQYTDQLIEALEKAQQQTTESENRVRKQNRHICELFDDNTALCQRIAELESRTVTVKLPNQTQFDDPLSAYEAIEKCKEALTDQGIKWEAE
ncbi:RelE family toxin-antitoxin system [Klebsiella michiganensis]|uniref:RelE family toxin-antitoxin system n=1 Tax=Klebsiella michiganensis TaxID=1134687 RepID=A0A7H4LWJ6_9ENTR|nr:hypothetical protein HMPREF3111_17990 [Proteus sp. HMSC10D02]STR40522.1 RelE family toxin-antitoxin system [Klebsiella michiganensis]STV76543.1 RelE family toxin-antitoxin system [Klebsiella michiganensis]